MENNQSLDTQSFSLYHTDKNLSAAQLLMQRYLSLFAQCKTVLDIGCGPGLFLEMLKSYNPSGTFSGIDNDPTMVHRVQQRGFNAHCLEVTTIDKTISDTYDGIYCGHIIEHLNGTDALHLCKTCFSLLNPGGIFLLKTPNWEIPYVRHEGFWLDITHVRPYPSKLLQKILSDIGFDNVRTFAENEGLHDVVALAIKNPAR